MNLLTAPKRKTLETYTVTHSITEPEFDGYPRPTSISFVIEEVGGSNKSVWHEDDFRDAFDRWIANGTERCAMYAVASFRNGCELRSHFSGDWGNWS